MMNLLNNSYNIHSIMKYYALRLLGRFTTCLAFVVCINSALRASEIRNIPLNFFPNFVPS